MSSAEDVSRGAHVQLAESTRPSNGPVRRLVLYASGVNRELLRMTPTDEDVFLVLGSAVLLAGTVAAVFGTVSSSLWARGELVLAWPYLLTGLLVGLFVASVDRLLVRSPLNPFRFPDEVTAALRAPTSQLEFNTALAAMYRPSGRSRLRQLGSVAPVFLMRFTLSLCLSYIVATFAIFVVFAPELEQRAAYLNGQIQGELIKETNAKYELREKRIRSELRALTAGDPAVVRTRNRIAAAQRNVEHLNRDLITLEAAYVNEVSQRVRKRFTLSSGDSVITSGIPGTGDTARSIEATIENTRRALDHATVSLRGARRALRSAEHAAAAAQSDLAARRSELETLLVQLERERETELSGLLAGPPSVKGLLIRQSALRSLETDQRPETARLDSPAPCDSWACELERAFLPPTPLGTWVLAFRVAFLLVDLLPILLKLQFSLRERRPYDAMLAAHEEIAVARALNFAHEGLVANRAEMDRRVRTALDTD